MKRTKLKLVRYGSHPTNFTACVTDNVIPKGLLPKCTPAIHSNNPQFWRQWNENLNHLARKQLKLLLEETRNHVTVLTTSLNDQLETLQASVNDHLTFTILTGVIENMASNLRNNLNLLRTHKLNHLLPTINNPSLTNQSNNDGNISDERNAPTATPWASNMNTTNTASRTPPTIKHANKEKSQNPLPLRHFSTTWRNRNRHQPFFCATFERRDQTLITRVDLRPHPQTNQLVWNSSWHKWFCETPTTKRIFPAK